MAYARARWYDARNASWLSEDPMGTVDSPSLYAFVGQQPNMATDPMGLCLDNCPLSPAAQAVVDDAKRAERQRREAERVEAARQAQIDAAAKASLAAGIQQQARDCPPPFGCISAAPSAEDLAWRERGWMAWRRDTARAMAIGFAPKIVGDYIAMFGSPFVGRPTMAPAGPPRQMVRGAPVEPRSGPAVAGPPPSARVISPEAPAGGSTYQERLAQTPVRGGQWSSQRGESTFVSNRADVRAILGRGGVSYENAYPNFAPVTKGQVAITGMSIDRYANFRLADEALALELGMTRAEVTQWRVQNKYTWHEGQDLKTMQLIPTCINCAFGHMGGVGELKRIQGAGVAPAVQEHADVP